MRRSRVVVVLNVLIVIAILAAVAVLALVALGGAMTATSISAGTPSTLTANGVTKITLPVTVSNKGYFAISGVDAQLSVVDSAGERLINGSVGPLTIGAGQTSTFNP
ncbi:MAG: hypothetical protein JRM99_09020 [Nitrososphaerota archaeon]|nr:hypothetical protein [Nitrososphaerota archaeon]